LGIPDRTVRAGNAFDGDRETGPPEAGHIHDTLFFIASYDHSTMGFDSNALNFGDFPGR
jgi:hypothetical protein